MIKLDNLSNKKLLAEMEEYASNHHVPIIKSDTANFIASILMISRPKKVLEIGTAIGYSAILTAEFLSSGGQIETIERNHQMVQIARENIIKAGQKDKITVIAGDALDVLPCLQKKYDYIFIDAAKGQYPEFLVECTRLISEGGIIICDNTSFRGMVEMTGKIPHRRRTIVNRLKSLVEMVNEDDRFISSIIPIGDGMIMMVNTKLL